MSACNAVLDALQAGGRTGKGTLHRPHRTIVWLSLPVALLFSAAAVIGLLLAVNKIFGSGAPLNYTLLETIAARHWCAATLSHARAMLQCRTTCIHLAHRCSERHWVALRSLQLHMR